MSIEITHLFHHGQHTRAVAEMIYNEFWIDVVGLCLDFLDAHLQNTHDPSRIRLSLIALVDDQLVGTVSLIETTTANASICARGSLRWSWRRNFVARASASSSCVRCLQRRSGWALQRCAPEPTGRAFMSASVP